LPYLQLANATIIEGMEWLTSPRRHRGAEGVTVKTIVSLFVAAWLISGCLTGGNVSHEDSPGATKRDEGPALCRDGSTPPCNDRD
jgi:hypothetical protein